MEWWNWIIEHFAEIWEVVLVLGGLAIYVAKKSKDGKLSEVWEWVKEEIWERAEGALLEVEPADVDAIAGPFWDNYLADIKILRLFVNKERFLDFCWDRWERFVDTLGEVELAVAQRVVVGSRAFS